MSGGAQRHPHTRTLGQPAKATDIEIGAVWCGDPQLHPAEQGVTWWNIADENWPNPLLSSSASVAEWWRALHTTRALLTGGARSVTLLWVGAIAVLDDVSALWSGASPLLVVPRVMRELPNDGAVPNDRDLLEAGRFSTHVVTFGRDSLGIIDWLGRNVGDADACDDNTLVGRWLDVVAAASTPTSAQTTGSA